MERDKRSRAADIGDEALAFEAGPERDALVEKLCAGDPELVQFVHDYISWSGDEAPDESLDRYLGKSIGPWTLIKVLGSGGFGVVFLAERKDPNQRAAIKLLQGTVHGRDSLARFRQEQQALAKLNHPYIVQLKDVGVTDEGQPYFVMDYVDGAKPIDVYCRDQKLTTLQKIELFQKVCEAVSAAHHNLILHRDLKPGNILVAKDGTPKLVDFNLAKPLDSRDQVIGASKSRAGLGTELYMSPEQARGEDVKTTTDVYSLGIILYELLTGTDPYNFESRIQDASEKIICEVPPEPPSQAIRRSIKNRRSERNADVTESNLAVLRKELSGDIDTILQFALRKEPTRRYQSVDHFKEDLALHLQIQPIRARPDSSLYRLSRCARRNKARVSGIAIGLLVSMSVGFVLYLAFAARRSHYVIAGPTGPTSRYTVDDYIYVKLNGKPVKYGKFTGCGPPETPSICSESAAISFTAAPGDQLEIVAYDLGGGYLLSELELYKENKPSLKLNDAILNEFPKSCKPIPCSWDTWRSRPTVFFGWTFTLP